VAQLNLKLTDEQIDALRKYAHHRRTPVAWLIKDYIDYLLRGGDPVAPDDLSSAEIVKVIAGGGAFDWLADEPDLYSIADGEAV
jgi:hypothetical protein